jgi:hypothetical protein
LGKCLGIWKKGEYGLHEKISSHKNLANLAALFKNIASKFVQLLIT